MPRRKPTPQATVTLSFVERSRGRIDAEISVKASDNAEWTNSRAVWSRESPIDALHKAVAEIERAANNIQGPKRKGIKSVRYFGTGWAK